MTSEISETIPERDRGGEEGVSHGHQHPGNTGNKKYVELGLKGSLHSE